MKFNAGLIKLYIQTDQILGLAFKMFILCTFEY